MASDVPRMMSDGKRLRPIWQPGDGDGDPSSEIFEKTQYHLRGHPTWKLFVGHVPYPIVIGKNEPPHYIYLDDRAAYDIWSSKAYSNRELRHYWPQDFNHQGHVKQNRSNRGRPAYKDESEKEYAEAPQRGNLPNHVFSGAPEMSDYQPVRPKKPTREEQKILHEEALSTGDTPIQKSGTLVVEDDESDQDGESEVFSTPPRKLHSFGPVPSDSSATFPMKVSKAAVLSVSRKSFAPKKRSSVAKKINPAKSADLPTNTMPNPPQIESPTSSEFTKMFPSDDEGIGDHRQIRPSKAAAEWSVQKSAINAGKMRTTPEKNREGEASTPSYMKRNLESATLQGEPVVPKRPRVPMNAESNSSLVQGAKTHQFKPVD